MHPKLKKISLRSTSFRRIFALLILLGVALAQSSCSQSRHPVQTARLAPSTRSELSGILVQKETSFENFMAKVEEPGPIKFSKFVAADWAVDRSGLVNLKHRRAKAAHLEDGPEKIQVYFYILDHPTYGSFMVDTGIARSVALRSDDMPIKWPVTFAMPMEDLRVRLDTKSYLDSRKTPLAGVFLTHLHLDHILGLQDIEKSVPLYVGPEETLDQRFTHLLVRPTTNANLKGFGPLREWTTQQEASAPLAYVDIFGDQSILGLHVPGHSRGNMAFLVRSTEGPQLIAGDSCHTEWGWNNEVEPGTFNTDGEQAAHSLATLEALAHSIAKLKIHLGHQELSERSL